MPEVLFAQSERYRLISLPRCRSSSAPRNWLDPIGPFVWQRPGQSPREGVGVGASEL